jgi:hypothetical protein
LYQEVSRLLCVNDGGRAECLDQQIPKVGSLTTTIDLAWGEHGLQ